MEVYPHKTPIILSDEVFTEYGGQVGQSLPVQRNAAYMLAEQQMTTYIGTFLLPTTVTGTKTYDPYRPHICTEYGYVEQVHNLRVLNAQHQELWNITGTSSYYYVSDDTYGHLQYVDMVHRYSDCYYGTGTPHFIEYAYTAGLPTGVATQPAVMLGLVMAAQLSLNEMVFPFSNETTGDAGVEEYASLSYREKRKPWKNSAFGASVKAAKIASLVDGTIRKARRAVVFR
jgi:hypothetical protein